MPDFSPSLQSWLATLLSDTGAVAGTIHIHERGGLRLAAAVNIPAKLREIVAWVASGKGMAGLALERGEPVGTCNLQEDQSGAIQPGAKAVHAQAAVALPVRDKSGGIIAIVGVAFSDSREIRGAELERLRAADRFSELGAESSS